MANLMNRPGYRKLPGDPNTPAVVRNLPDTPAKPATQKLLGAVERDSGAASSTPQAGAATATSPSMQGVSQNTQNHLNQYQAGYTPSAAVNQAQQYLNNVLGGRPGEYTSPYATDIESLYNQIMNQPDFTFDINGNALYQMYADQYTQQGQNAMMNTMGQAAAMTGGYGNSYASTAGNQAYQQYLQQLNAVIPQIYQMELEKYNSDRDALLQQYGMASDADSEAYGRWQQAYQNWLAESGMAQDAYNTAYNQDYGAWQDAVNYWTGVAQNENSAFFNQQQFDAQQAADNRQYAYNQAMAILQAGQMPSAALLSAAGISQQDANTIRNSNRRRSSSSSSSSGSRSSGGSQQTQQNSIRSLSDLSGTALNLYMSCRGVRGRTIPKHQIYNKVINAWNADAITDAEADYILNVYGITRR